MFKSVVTAVVLIALTACSAPRPHPSAPPPPNEPAPGLQSLPAAGNYPIDAGHSELRVLVYRAGPLSRLGHNHVMVNRAVSGSVQIAATLEFSSFTLSVPVDTFSVDDAQSRQQEGSDFPTDVPEDSKSGTLHNMLSAAVLNATKFPTITVKGSALNSKQGALSASLKISVAGHESTVVAPLVLSGDAQHLTATGSFELRQTDIGLTPYSLLGGALQVQDAMQLKFKISVVIS